MNFHSSHLDAYIERLKTEDQKMMLSWIFCVFAENVPQAKLKAARTLNEYLQSCSIDDILHTDTQMRFTTWVERAAFIEWHRLAISSFFTSQMSLEERRAVLVFASFHCCGYIRQQAVDRLPDYPQTLPIITLRLIDWVPQIRSAATAAFIQRTPQATDQEILDTLSIVSKLYKRARLDPTEVIALLAPRIENRNAELLEKALTSDDIHVRRFCISNFYQFMPNDDSLLLAHITSERDPFLRLMIFRQFVRSDRHRHSVCVALLQDSYPLNRKLALLALADNNPATAYAHARTMLLDKNAQVRDVAKEMARRYDPTFDSYRFYRERLESQPVVSLQEIARAGKREDTHWIEKFLTAPNIAVIYAAMSALMQLDASTYLPRITEILASKDEGIMKRATKLIHKYGNYRYNYLRIFEIQRDSDSEETKIRCSSLLFEAPKWQSLIYMLRLLDSRWSRLMSFCLSHITTWLENYNRSYQEITPTERKEILHLVAEKEVWLTKPESAWHSKATVDLLRFAVK